MTYRSRITALRITAIAVLLSCSSGYAMTQPLSQKDSVNQAGNVLQTFSETLLISTPDATWTKSGHSIIELSRGSLIVIAGEQPITIKSAIGKAFIPAGCAAAVQQEKGCATRIGMVGVRGKVASPDRSEWVITVDTAEGSTYKLSFGDVLISDSEKDGTDTTIIQQSPGARRLIRAAAHQLNSIALSIDVNGVLLGDQTANDCAGMLLSLTQGNTIGTAIQQKDPVEIFVDDGTKFVAVERSSTSRDSASAELVVARK